MYNKNEDDVCDIYSKKICDNCGKCLELEGVDIRAINIDDIAKTVEENQYLEDELKNALDLLKEENESEESVVEEEEAIDYTAILDADEEYKDAFDDIVYFDDIGLDEDMSMDDLTDEVYPGLRKFKNK